MNNFSKFDALVKDIVKTETESFLKTIPSQTQLGLTEVVEYMDNYIKQNYMGGFLSKLAIKYYIENHYVILRGSNGNYFTTNNKTN